MADYYGCHNRPPLRTRAMVQDGWNMSDWFMGVMTKTPLMIEIPDPMSKDCQYVPPQPDPKCSGCQHAKEAA